MGARALRLLTLSSVLALAACGGGGDPLTVGDSGSPGEQPPPVVQPSQKRVVITGENQLDLASHAGSAMSGMGPMGFFIAQFMLPEVPAEPTLQRSAVPTASTPATPTGAAGVLAASLQKFVPATSTRARLVVGVTTTETHQVECSSGSGTVTTEESEGDASSTRTVTAVLDHCRTDLRGSEVVINGKLKFTITERDAAEGPYAIGDILAEEYSVKDGEIDVSLDGDMHVEASEGGYVTSGERFSISGFGIFEGEEEEGGAEAARTVTMLDYRQEVLRSEDGYTVTSEATVETDEFGELAVYELRTEQPLFYSYAQEAYAAGKIRILGANDTVLVLTANGDGTFKLERNDGGDASVDATVDGLTADDLDLDLLWIF